MSQQFKLPDLGEGIHEGEILEVPVAVGDEIEEDDIILTVETDKASVDIPSPFAGKIKDIHIDAGDIVNVGDVLLTFSGDTEEAETEETETQAADKEEAEEAEVQEEAREKQPEVRDEEREEASQQEPDGDRPVPAAPATRRLARERDIDLRQVEGSGPGGRVTREDVESFSEGQQSQKEETEAEEAEKLETSPEGEKRIQPTTPELPDFGKWGEVERVPLRSVRRATARRMAQSWSNIPHVSHHDKADVTELEALRQQYQNEQDLENLTLTVFVMKATVAALKQYPRFNASLDTEANEIVLKKYYHIGLAVATERGLIVPVIRDVDSKSLNQLTDEITTLVKRARAGETDLEEMQGGTFTITNVGPIGGTHFDPIINFPQVAILGMARVGWEPIIIKTDNGDREIEPRYMLPLVLGFDHRLADGAEAAHFINDVKAMLEDPDRFMLRL